MAFAGVRLDLGKRVFILICTGFEHLLLSICISRFPLFIPGSMWPEDCNTFYLRVCSGGGRSR